jgi:glycerol-3-phosphate acyltransferase PlsY
MIGHIFPVFFKFRGGKGVACAGATVFCVDYRVGLILLGVIVVIVLITRYVSLASITAAMAFPLCMFLFYDQNPVITGMSAVFTVIIILTHWQNIVRLVNGEENKISFKKKNK